MIFLHLLLYLRARQHQGSYLVMGFLFQFFLYLVEIGWKYHSSKLDCTDEVRIWTNHSSYLFLEIHGLYFEHQGTDKPLSNAALLETSCQDDQVHHPILLLLDNQLHLLHQDRGSLHKIIELVATHVNMFPLCYLLSLLKENILVLDVQIRRKP